MSHKTNISYDGIVEIPLPLINNLRFESWNNKKSKIIKKWEGTWHANGTTRFKSPCFVYDTDITLNETIL